MQGAWGKRALSAMAVGYKRNWNNLRGAWGKREMPANAAKGQSVALFVILFDWDFTKGHLFNQVSNGHGNASRAGTTSKVFGAETKSTEK